MKKFLKINDRAFISVDKIESVGLAKDGKVVVLTPYPSEESGFYTEYAITDGRTLSDIMAEIEGEAEQKVCKWKKESPEYVVSTHYEFISRPIEWLPGQPYCPICGGKIEVVE